MRPPNRISPRQAENFRQARRVERPKPDCPRGQPTGIAELQILVDTREQYPYRFTTQQAITVKRALPCGDYGITVDARLVAAVERKSIADFVSSLINGKLRYAIGDLAALPSSRIHGSPTVCIHSTIRPKRC